MQQTPIDAKTIQRFGHQTSTALCANAFDRVQRITWHAIAQLNIIGVIECEPIHSYPARKHNIFGATVRDLVDQHDRATHRAPKTQIRYGDLMPKRWIVARRKSEYLGEFQSGD